MKKIAKKYHINSVLNDTEKRLLWLSKIDDSTLEDILGYNSNKNEGFTVTTDTKNINKFEFFIVEPYMHRDRTEFLKRVGNGFVKALDSVENAELFKRLSNFMTIVDKENPAMSEIQNKSLILLAKSLLRNSTSEKLREYYNKLITVQFILSNLVARASNNQYLMEFAKSVKLYNIHFGYDVDDKDLITYVRIFNTYGIDSYKIQKVFKNFFEEDVKVKDNKIIEDIEYRYFDKSQNIELPIFNNENESVLIERLKDDFINSGVNELLSALNTVQFIKFIEAIDPELKNDFSVISKYLPSADFCEEVKEKINK